jgi:membrane fusion protein, multidrug efflux system
MSERKYGIGSKVLRFLKWPIAIAGLALMIAWTGGMFHAKTEAGKLDTAPGKPLPDKAKTYTVKVARVAPKIDVVGTVASEETVHLSARISAYVSRVSASAGQRVKKGQVLIELDSREIKEKLAAANIHLKQSRTEYKRTLSLYKQKAATEQAMTAAESRNNAARSQVAEIEVMLTYTQIQSPINGIVTERRVEKGDLANPGQILLSVYDPLNMRLVVPVPVRLIEKLSLKKSVDIGLDRPTRPFKGRVSEIVSAIDPLSRTQEVKVHINNKKGDILPGTFGRVWVYEDPHPAVLVPASAIVLSGQLEMVHLVLDNRVVRRMVKTGPVFGKKVEILSGLSQGDIILVFPLKEDS